MIVALPASWTALQFSPYKELAQTLQVAGARVVAETSGPLGVVMVVESPTVPFRHAPGLSLLASTEPPPQLALFTDGDRLTAINRFGGRWESLAYLDFLTSALPYHLLQRPEVLILGAGGGTDILQALALGARTFARLAIGFPTESRRLRPGIYSLVAGELLAGNHCVP